MHTQSVSKPTAFITILILVLTFGTASIGLAGGTQPDPAGFALAKSKGVDGLLNAVVLGDEVVQYIVLMCKESPVVLGPSVNIPSQSPENLAETTAECPGSDPLGELCLEGWIFRDAAADPALADANCFPEAEAGILADLSISRVKNFINTGTAISAEVTLQLGQGE